MSEAKVPLEKDSEDHKRESRKGCESQRIASEEVGTLHDVKEGFGVQDKLCLSRVCRSDQTVRDLPYILVC
jgi:hypothetical protein